MAPTNPDVFEWQTNQILKYLLEDDDHEEYQNRCQLQCNDLEVDSPPGANCDDKFDPVLIADKLKTVADELNKDFQFQAALREMKQAAAQEALEAAFSHGVEAIYQAQVSKQADLAPEWQLIRATVALGLYIKKSSPELKDKVCSAMNDFLNRRLGTWVTQQGGWAKAI